MVQKTTEQDRLRQVIEARKTMRKFAKVAWTIGALVIGGLSFWLAPIIVAAIVMAAYVGIGAFLHFSFNHSDAMDRKRIAELDANPGQGQGLLVKKDFAAIGSLGSEVNEALDALAASATKMTERREQVDEAIKALREQTLAITKALATIGKTLSGEDDEKLAAEESGIKADLASGNGDKTVLESRLESVQNRRQNVAELKEQEAAYLDKLKLIRDEAKDLKLGLEKALAEDGAEDGALNDAIRSIKVETATAAQMKALSRSAEHI